MKFLRSLSRQGILVVSALSMLVSNQAFAIRPVRCHGRIQYRPCEEPTRTAVTLPVRKEHLEIHHQAPRDPRLFAEVISRKFKAEGRDGFWSGDIKGFGQIYLTLVLKENGEVRETRAMGSIPLQGSATTFAFRTAVPKYPNWSWDIAARAENLK